jgi:hypothetical protein
MTDDDTPPEQPPEEPTDYEPGWKGLSILFFWRKWQWVHALLGHQIVHDPRGGQACNCGMKWE